MPRPYSADLRERVLLAYEAGEEVKDVARRFRVGSSTVYLWRQQAHDEGRRTPKARARRGEPVGGNATVLAELVAEQTDATLQEYAAGLAERTGRRWSAAAVCRALQRLGLARKKRRSGPRSKRAPTSPLSARRGAPRWPRSIRRGSSSSTRAASTRA